MTDESRPTITEGTRPSKPSEDGNKAKLDEKGRPLTEKPSGKKDSPASVSVRLGVFLFAFLSPALGSCDKDETKTETKVEEKSEAKADDEKKAEAKEEKAPQPEVSETKTEEKGTPK